MDSPVTQVSYSGRDTSENLKLMGTPGEANGLSTPNLLGKSYREFATNFTQITLGASMTTLGP